MTRSLLSFAMPDFLGIGAARSGTTWLWHYLRKHPEIWTHRTKEIHFFDRRFKRRLVPIIPREVEAAVRYGRFFAKGKILRKVTGEVSPGYGIMSLDQIAFVHRIVPDARLIFIMRNPVTRAWSHCKKEFKVATGTPLEDASYEELVWFVDQPRVVIRGDYVRCLNNWLALYPREQLFTLLTDDVASNPRRVLEDLFSFLGVETAIDWEALGEIDHPEHVSSEIPMPDDLRSYLEDSLSRQYNDLESLIGRDLPWHR